MSLASAPTGAIAPWGFDRASCQVDLDAFDVLLRTKQALSERDDIFARIPISPPSSPRTTPEPLPVIVSASRWGSMESLSPMWVAEVPPH